MLDRAIKNIRKVEGLEQVHPLEQLAENFKHDAIELCHVREASLDPLIEERLILISKCMEQKHGELVDKVEKMSKELELIQTEVSDVADEMELLKQCILSSYTEIERAKQAIAKAQAILDLNWNRKSSLPNWKP